jgi:hypothetical protein
MTSPREMVAHIERRQNCVDDVIAAAQVLAIADLADAVRAFVKLQGQVIFGTVELTVSPEVTP